MPNTQVGTWIASDKQWRYFIYKENALYLQWPKSKSLSLSREIKQLVSQVEQQLAIVDYAVGYHSCVIYFDPKSYQHQDLITILETITPSVQSHTPSPPIVIPIDFSEEYALDLPEVAARCDLSPTEVKTCFIDQLYTVHFMGFMPGFVYMGGLDDRLHLPRRSTPRLSVPAGSIAIAAGQTGIYPIDIPGGWHIIGKTDMRFFDIDNDPPTSLTCGTNIKFESIS